MNLYMDSAGPPAVPKQSQTAPPSPTQSANAPISPLGPDDYFSAGGFLFSRDMEGAWVGAEAIDSGLYNDYDHCVSPLAPAPAPADGQAAASVPGAMDALPRPKRLWSQIPKADPSSSSPAPTTSGQTTQRHRIRSKSTKLSGEVQQQQQQHDMEAATPTVAQHQVGSRDQTTLDTLHVEEVGIRRTHNQVEKKYRNRLNAQFERLLAVLPTESEEQEEEEGQRQRWKARVNRVLVPDKIITKADVLRMATQRIKTLELQNRELLQYQSQLRWNLNAAGGATAAAATTSVPIAYINAVLGQPRF